MEHKYCQKLYPMEVKLMESIVYKQPVWYKRHLTDEEDRNNIRRISLKR